MSQLTVDQVIQLALDHQSVGQLAEAENLFRQILEVYPDQADALHLLGTVYIQAKRPDLAEPLLRQAIGIRPEPAFRLSLGAALHEAKRFDDAVTHYQRLILDLPEFVEAYIHLGVVLSIMGRFSEAAVVFQNAIRLAPDHPVAQGNLGIVLCQLKRWEDAIGVLREAIARTPDDADFHASLGAALYFTRQFEESLASCRKALAMNPKQVQAHSILSLALRDLGRAPEADAAARAAAELLPDEEQVQIHHGENLRAAGKLDEAEAHYKSAIAHHPGAGDLYNNLANVYKDKGMLDEAIMNFRRAISRGGNAPSHYHHSNLIYTMNYHPAYSPLAIYGETQRYNLLIAEPLAGEIRPHLNDRSPARRLRIGYISSEFRQHALGLNLLPVLAHHDKSQFEIYCYSSVATPDFYTFRFRQCADQWRDVQGGGITGTPSDSQHAELIRKDQIDILIDLHQHMSGTRLPLFARKPAPVQIAFAGYPGTTGLATIDYRLTDPYLDPPEPEPQQPGSEIALRLPHSFWCYQPVIELPVHELPALSSGTFTFGNLNNFCKLNEFTLKLWAKIMQGVPDSQLILLAPEGTHREGTLNALEKLGIRRDRVRFFSRMPTGNYYQLYNQIDLTLDSFPCNGHTTSMDSFFMGVPVMTFIGKTLFGRATWSQLNNLQLTELAGKNEQEFVDISLALARDLPRLAALRRTLRERMKASPLMDQISFTRGIEAAYRKAWQSWRGAASK